MQTQANKKKILESQVGRDLRGCVGNFPWQSMTLTRWPSTLCSRILTVGLKTNCVLKPAVSVHTVIGESQSVL